MRSLALYTYVMLRGIYYYKGPNSTSAPLSCVVNTNTECLCLCRWPSLQLADIPVDISVDILADILANILSVS